MPLCSVGRQDGLAWRGAERRLVRMLGEHGSCGADSARSACVSADAGSCRAALSPAPRVSRCVYAGESPSV